METKVYSLEIITIIIGCDDWHGVRNVCFSCIRTATLKRRWNVLVITYYLFTRSQFGEGNKKYSVLTALYEFTTMLRIVFMWSASSHPNGMVVLACFASKNLAVDSVNLNQSIVIIKCYFIYNTLLISTKVVQLHVSLNNNYFQG